MYEDSCKDQNGPRGTYVDETKMCTKQSNPNGNITYYENLNPRIVRYKTLSSRG